MHLRRLLTVFLTMLAALSLPAQNAPVPPDLNGLLRHAQDNYWEYRSGIPDFFADEHVVSTMKQDDTREIKTTTDSIFRLVRSHTIGEEPTLHESREVRLVNKKPVRSDQLRGPAVFTGAFSSAPSTVSIEMSYCFDYTLEPPATLNKQPALLISYSFRPDMLHDDGCPGPEKQSGRAWLDPVSFHLLRLETAVPNHIDNNGIRMLWTWSADFAPVDLDGKKFWLPSTIISRAEANNGSAVWSFTATYSNYHHLTVKSRIITNTDADPPPPR